MESIFDWPGKSDGEGNERPAVLHMLDVAACAEWLIEGHRGLFRFSAKSYAKNRQRRQTATIVIVGGE